MIDKLQAKIDKHIASYDVDFEEEVHVFEFVDGTIIKAPLEYFADDGSKPSNIFFI